MGADVNVTEANPAERPVGTQDGVPAPLVGPGDEIQVSVFGDQQISGKYRVNEQGEVTLPLAGPIKVAGQPPSGVAELIAAALREQRLFRDPRVTVDMATMRPFYILGEVNRPGEYAYQPGMSLFAAVATAGGFTYRADADTVFIRRANESLERRYDIDADIAIAPGDIVRIAERYF